MSDKDSKTEKASPKKLRDARKKGELVKSPDLVSATSFLIFSIFFVPLWEYVIRQCSGLIKSYYTNLYGYENLENNLSAIGFQNIMKFFVIVAPFMVIAFFSAWVSNLLQVGFLFTTKPIKPDFKKLNPISGFKNLFNKKALFTLLKNLGKLILVFTITLHEIKSVLGNFFNAGSVGIHALPFFILNFLKKLSFKLAIILFLLGVLDYVVQWLSFRKKMKMSKQEVKDEYKQQEGDQLIKSKRKSMYMELISGMMGQVKDSTVVITNPTHLAIAIQYDKENNGVPIVVAKGAELIAKKIREEATLNNVPILENKPVARSLYKSTEIGQPIPVDMYETIAEILAFVYKMNEENKYKI
ncbi:MULTISPECIES: EscU/YscU/HrcU family type III secretion system export apparatus switch protein [Vagococcus]|uniref:Flagellar biosynthesis protein FlhB n=1 Tax=Vagococcus fluvialis bH819 TaxID=1255619 RepID=A0A1X6WRM7_9ENTE|nr:MULTISPECIES: EscU/YscU/HrcU family type III secretion system export apparatus switch protein [Vagococcus]SLM86892.1 Flagellar biosynthesis protein FlhB [Vagococcus fluvialis bH819]HCM88651.1 flagellar type III secretion system protein FlhB [Vagococcus sp.]